MHYDFFMKTLLTKRVISTFMSPTLLAGYLAMIIPLTAGLLIDNLRRIKLAVFLVIAILFAACVMALTKSIGGFISLFAAILVFLAFTGKRKMEPTRTKARGFLGKILSVQNLIRDINGSVFGRECMKYIALSGLLILATATVITITARQGQFLDFSYPENSVIQRLNYWRSSLEIIKDNPIKGVGWGNFGAAYQKYMLPGATETRAAHNNYLQLWVELGVFGLIGFLWLAFLFIRKTPKTGLQIGLLSAGVAFLVYSLFDYGLFISQVAFHWWVILGLNASWRE